MKDYIDIHMQAYFVLFLCIFSSLTIQLCDAAPCWREAVFHVKIKAIGWNKHIQNLNKSTHRHERS